jgi:hypothetical protein
MQTIKHQPKNVHERSARFAKVYAIRRAMDRAIRAAARAANSDVDPDDDPHAVADALEKWPARDWNAFCEEHGIRKPSAITIGQVIDGYRKDGGARPEVIETTGEELPVQEVA